MLQRSWQDPAWQTSANARCDDIVLAADRCETGILGIFYDDQLNTSRIVVGFTLLDFSTSNNLHLPVLLSLALIFPAHSP
jgi:hypothetical protein